MTRRSLRRAAGASLLALALLALTACGQLNRATTLNQPAHTTTAAAVESALEQQLAKLGVSNPKVTCAKTLIVNVGTTNTCALTGERGKLVRFTFANSKGEINVSSVQPK
jgi:hypothetical protein